MEILFFNIFFHHFREMYLFTNKIFGRFIKVYIYKLNFSHENLLFIKLCLDNPGILFCPDELINLNLFY